MDFAYPETVPGRAMQVFGPPGPAPDTPLPPRPLHSSPGSPLMQSSSVTFSNPAEVHAAAGNKAFVADLIARRAVKP